MIRPVALSGNPISSWAKLVQQSSNRNTLIAGSGISQTQGTNGTTISLKDDTYAERLVFAGEYDPNAEYFPNDVVVVNPNTKYTIVENGVSRSLDIDSTYVSGYDKAPLGAGTFVCIKYVPASWSDEDYYDYLRTNVYTDNIDQSIIDTIRWNSYNIYYPVCPTISSSLTQSITPAGYDSTITANDTYWQPLTGECMKLQTCNNNNVNTVYVCGFTSGSHFRDEYLPYQSPA